MTPVEFRCPQCRALFSQPPTQLGRPVRCGRCETVFTPSAEPKPVAPIEPELLIEDRPAKPRAKLEDPPEEPTGGGVGVLAALLVVLALGLLALAGVGIAGYRVYQRGWGTPEAAPPAAAAPEQKAEPPPTRGGLPVVEVGGKPKP